MSKKQESINTEKQRISEELVKDYIIKRFEDVKGTSKIKNLVSFQAMNKYMIMAHDQNELKILGNIVASNKKIQFSEILIEYEKHLKKSFEKKPTIKTHSNVIMHIFGHFSKNFNQHSCFCDDLARTAQHQLANLRVVFDGRFGHHRRAGLAVPRDNMVLIGEPGGPDGGFVAGVVGEGRARRCRQAQKRHRHNRNQIQVSHHS